MKTKLIAALSLVFAFLLSAGCSKKAEEENIQLRLALTESAAKNSASAVEIAKLTSERDRLKDSLNEAQSSISSIGESSKTRELELKAQLSDAIEKLRASERSLAESEQKVLALERQAKENVAGEIKGTVHYFFNHNFGEKPDTGSKVYIFLESDHPSFDPEKLTEYEKLKKEGDSEKIKSIDGALFKMLASAQFDKKTKRLAVDGNGSFSAKLKSGAYWVIIQSAHRTSLTMLEVAGQLSWERVEVVAGEEIQIAAHFYP